MRRVVTVARAWSGPIFVGFVLAPLMAVLSPVLAQIAPMGICEPVSQRTSEEGCWIIANEPLGRLPDGPFFWYLDRYPTRTAGEAAKNGNGTVVEALGSMWLLTIAEAGWEPRAGARVATIGPLPVRSDTEYTAQYMEAIHAPGTTTPVHWHPGPEAWYMLSGRICLETPAGKTVAQPGGEHVIVPAGRPMHLTVTGAETRRSLVLILHDSTQPAGSPVHDWTPTGVCKS